MMTRSTYRSPRFELISALTLQVDPSGSVFEQYNLLQTATTNSKLAATYVDGGAMLMFQNDTNTSSMWLVDTSQRMVSILNEAIP